MRKLLVLPFFIFQFLIVSAQKPCSLITTVSTIANVSCNGGDNGSATANPSNGTAPYTYSWSDASSQSNDTAIGLSAGNYTVTVQDAGNCTASASVVVTEPNPINVLVSVPHISCIGRSVCGYTIASGGTPFAENSGYDFSWTDSTNAIVSTSSQDCTLRPGMYTVTATDSNGCTGSTSVLVTGPDIYAFVVNNVNCNGGTNGTAAVSISNGQPLGDYHFTWIPSYQITDTAFGLSSGTYTVYVSDICEGGEDSMFVTITQPGTLTILGAGPINNVSCNGASDGRATVTFTGGTAPFTYAWSNGTTTVSVSRSTPAILSAGSYTVTVTDSCGNSATASTLILQPNILRDSVKTLVNVECNSGNGGSITLGCKGGTFPYLFSWSNGSSLQTAYGLSAGTYSVIITDQHGCTNILTGITITQPLAIRDSVANITYPLCYGEKGSTSIGVKGGQTPYTYSWTSNLSSTATATNVAPGSYTVTIKDVHGCTSAVAFTMTQPVAMRDSVVKSATVEISCHGNNGSAKVGVKYGNAPYTYRWTPNVSSSATASGLSAGTYSVMITDKNGCTAPTVAVVITQIAALQDSVSVLTFIGCNGGNGGEISIGTRGGSTPYTYVWSPNNNSTYTVSGLSIGNYSVVITDHNGCTNTLNPITVTQPGVLRDSIAAITYPACNGDKGSITVGVKGGTLPYYYSWNPNVSTTGMANNLTARSYTIMVKDKYDCPLSPIVVTLTQPAALRDTIVGSSKVNVSCKGGNNGSATVGVKNGTFPYTFNWSNGNTTATVSGLSAGIYSVTVTDNNGCSGSVTTVNISQPAMALTSFIGSVSCINNRIKASANGIGGTPPYTYVWTPGGATTSLVNGLSQGVYTVTVTDANGCSSTDSKNLVCGGIVKDDGQDEPQTQKCCDAIDNINLYPNPNSGQFTLSGLEQGQFIEMYDYTGRKINLQSTIYNSQLSINISGQPNGIYLIRVLDKDGNLVSQKKLVKTN